MRQDTLKGMLLAVMLLTGPATWAQTPAPATPTQEKAPLSDKQKQLLDEANALLKMAAELKVSVDKSTKDQLSLDVVRKAEAVEKAARELKTKLK
jgi:type VI protein secretion system component VasF